MSISRILLIRVLALIALVAAFSSCNESKYITDDDLVLKKVRVLSNTTDVQPSVYRQYVKQQPSTRMFGMVKYPPVAYNENKTQMSVEDMTQMMQNQGYLHARTLVDTVHRKERDLEITYILDAGEPFFIRSLRYDIEDTELLADRSSLLDETILHVGDQFSVDRLDEERKRITAYLNQRGYYHFNKDFISFSVDSVKGSKELDVTMHLLQYRANNNEALRNHPSYHIGKVNFLPGDSTGLHIRLHQLHDNTWLREGEVYNSENLRQTYGNFGRLQAVRYTNIRLRERPDTTLIDCDVQLMTQRPSLISFTPEGTNTAGDLGAAATLSYQNRNLFRGSELLSIELRGAYEAIRGLEGYQNNDFVEYGGEVRLQFPRLVLPFASHSYVTRVRATSELLFSANRQSRPEFRRQVTRAMWRYTWHKIGNSETQLRWDVLDINYIRMPWISQTFKENYLDDPTNRNAILRYNYQDLFIMRMGASASVRKGNTAYKFNVESAGNVLGAVMPLLGGTKNDEGYYRLFNVAYAQYLKMDVDMSHLIRLDNSNELAMHFGLGVACPYGNSSILPYEKRYFSGGANSVRGWSVRGLGPGKFKGTDGRIDFINQTGDVKLDMSVELRTFLFWKFYSAFFIDAGNIWTLRDYKDQPGGQFKFSEFYKQIAVAYGLGLRMNFSYFFLRFDAGMKAINPAYENSKQHYAIIHPKLSRDFAFHFAVGMPF